jgi:hypothetical protein
MERIRRINHLANKLNSHNYLEIGVRDGETLDGISIPMKTGVDPVFRFDWQLAMENTPSLRLHQCTSDEFFLGSLADSSYDFIYLDGLHHYEQTFRDLLHAIRICSDKGVILIDDTVPCDAYSCSRDMDEAFSLRRATNPDCHEEWHGDTYKLIPLINLLLPAYEYITMMDSGNPQTILWKRRNLFLSSEIETLISFLALDNLSACDFLWMRRNLHLWHPKTELEAIDLVCSDILQ